MKSHAIIGCGTVGGSVASLLLETQEKTGLHLKYVMDRTFDHAKKLGVPESLFESNFQTILNDEEVITVIELVGGLDFARELITASLKAGKNVVTANKALLAYYGKELFTIAQENNVCLAFEASCGGGIPIIRALSDGLVANRITSIFGIVNGTCNYILSEMFHKGIPYSDALKQAQGEGLAEACPELDVNGSDSAHKIAIMAAIAFGQSVHFESISIRGINELQSVDISYGKDIGYCIKLIASAINVKHGIFLRVEPAFIAETHPFVWVSGAFNAISVYGNPVGHTMFYGRGAGGPATASAVVADAISMANGSYSAMFNNFSSWPSTTSPANQLSPDDMQRKYYVRFYISPKNTLRTSITSLLNSYNIGIDMSKEYSMNEDNTIPLVVITDEVKEAKIKTAVKEILSLKGVHSVHSLLPIITEPLEFS